MLEMKQAVGALQAQQTAEEINRQRLEEMRVQLATVDEEKARREAMRKDLEEAVALASQRQIGDDEPVFGVEDEALSAGPAGAFPGSVFSAVLGGGLKEAPAKPVDMAEVIQKVGLKHPELLKEFAPLLTYARTMKQQEELSRRQAQREAALEKREALSQRHALVLQNLRSRSAMELARAKGEQALTLAQFKAATGLAGRKLEHGFQMYRQAQVAAANMPDPEDITFQVDVLNGALNALDAVRDRVAGLDAGKRGFFGEKEQVLVTIPRVTKGGFVRSETRKVSSVQELDALEAGIQAELDSLGKRVQAVLEAGGAARQNLKSMGVNLENLHSSLMSQFQSPLLPPAGGEPPPPLPTLPGGVPPALPSPPSLPPFALPPVYLTKPTGEKVILPPVPGGATNDVAADAVEELRRIGEALKAQPPEKKKKQKKK